MKLFNRFASVIIGTEGSDGIEFSDLRISFSVNKTSDRDANKCDISIYGLSEKSRNTISSTNKKLILKAGYSSKSKIETVFIGDVLNITHIEVPPNIETQLQAADGISALQNAKISLSYKANTDLKTILNKAIKSFGIGIRKFDFSELKTKIFSGGFSFEGQSKILMDKICRELDLEWSIQNDEIKLLKKLKADDSTAVLLTAETGLIGSPRKVLDTIAASKQSKSTEKDIPGWEIETLLMPSINPGSIVAVKSKAITKETFFRVVNVNHRGDTHSPTSFMSTINVIEL